MRCTPVERDRDGGDTVKEEERDECRQTRRDGLMNSGEVEMG